jgi:hypothetical protein
VGDYNHEAKDWNYAGGELLDAFVFANFDIGDVAIGARAGKHTINWGNALLGTGNIASIASVMSPLDFGKALSVPGTEAKELYMPVNRLSTVIQLTDNLTLNAYYGLEHKAYRLPSDGTFFSPAAGLTEDSEFVTWPPTGRDVDEAPIRTGYHGDGYEAEDDGDFGFNVQYYVEAWSLETSFIYINYTDKNLHGLLAGLDLGQFGTVLAGAGNEVAVPLMAGWNGLCGGVPGVTDPFDCPNLPYDQGGGAIVTGEAKWHFKEDIDLFGISFAKEIAGISVGLDLVYRKDTGLNQELGRALFNIYNAPDWTHLGLPGGQELADGLSVANGLPVGTIGYIPGDFYSYDGDGNYLGPVGDMYSVVLNGLGLLNGDWGLWDGGSYIVEATFQMLDQCNDDCHLLDVRVNEDRVISHIAAVFNPTWYQVFPGWDMTLPMSVAYTIDGEKSPLTFGGDEERGNASIGVEFLVNQAWTVNAKYNTFFGPVNAGLGALNKDRDNISMTIKRTF